MNLFAVSFFGHREVDDPFVIEQQLEAIIRELLLTKEYVEFLVGRDGEFDQLVSSTIRRCKRTIRDDNSSLVLVLPYMTAEYRNNEQSFHEYYVKLKSVSNPQKSISSPPIKSGIGPWLTVRIWLFSVSNTILAELIRPCNMQKRQVQRS